ncbi:microtubule-associated proteins 1A/1B light chain 3A-like [Varroa jacobsoni]|uniref:Autophagy-related protein n=1 Tax=Varroa destructor TaxID=109461 RepID=A0A7M7J3N1_VARDE|nr:microtubule-associated proteins 1A/1B light chain 3A-like [Varroa destructor]XP_022706418.1 microtubule-associated proteins 1A/1B light chain 3A-like [Varroa jacobsoni]
MDSGCNETMPERSFKERRCFAQRKRDVEDILDKYNDKIPCVIERYNNEKRLPRLDRSKFLVSDYLSFGDLLRTIRRRLELHPDQAFFLLVNQRVMPPLSKTMSEIYSTDKDEDGYLYMVYASQEVFGASHIDCSNNCISRIAAERSELELLFSDEAK